MDNLNEPMCCEDCAYYDNYRSDMPCASCVGFENWERYKEND